MRNYIVKNFRFIAVVLGLIVGLIIVQITSADVRNIQDNYDGSWDIGAYEWFSGMRGNVAGGVSGGMQGGFQ